MSRNILLILVAVLVAPLTWFTLEYPMLAAIGAAALLLVVSLTKISGWWRRVYAITIISLFAGASHFELLVSVGSVAKMLSLALFTVVAFATTRNLKSQYANPLHKFALLTLWVTVGLALMSTLWSTYRMESIVQALAFTAFVYILHETSTKRWKDRTLILGDMSLAYWVCWALLLIGVILALAGVAGAVSDYSGRTLGLLGNPNRLGIVATMTLAIGIGVAVHHRRPLIWASLIIPLSQILLSESRTAIIATAIGVLWVVLRSGIIPMIVGLFATAITLLGSVALNFNPFGTTLDRFGAQEGGDVLNTRTQAWADTVSLTERYPLGTGWYTAGTALEDFNQAGITSGLTSVHNSYLNLLFELGWLGIIPAVLVTCIFIVIAIRARINGIGSGLVIATVAGALIHLTESTIFGLGQPYPYLFWVAVLAAIVHTGNVDDNQADMPEESRSVNRKARTRRTELSTR